jgi:hypothetical protein
VSGWVPTVVPGVTGERGGGELQRQPTAPRVGSHLITITSRRSVNLNCRCRHPGGGGGEAPSSNSGGPSRGCGAFSAARVVLTREYVGGALAVTEPHGRGLNWRGIACSPTTGAHVSTW